MKELHRCKVQRLPPRRSGYLRLIRQVFSQMSSSASNTLNTKFTNIIANVSDLHIQNSAKQLWPRNDNCMSIRSGKKQVLRFANTIEAPCWRHQWPARHWNRKGKASSLEDVRRVLRSTHVHASFAFQTRPLNTELISFAAQTPTPFKPVNPAASPAINVIGIGVFCTPIMQTLFTKDFNHEICSHFNPAGSQTQLIECTRIWWSFNSRDLIMATLIFFA